MRRERWGTLLRLIDLWRGAIPLPQAFWEYAVAYGTTLNLVATMAAVGSIALNWPEVVAVVLFLLPIPYIFIVVVGVLRSADRYNDRPDWARIARVAVVLWGAAMVLL